MKLSTIFRIPMVLAAFAIGYFGLQNSMIYFLMIPILIFQIYLIKLGDKQFIEWNNKRKASKGDKA